MEILILLGVILIIDIAIAYFFMKFFKRFTAKSEYSDALNVLVFILSLAIVIFLSLLIVGNTIYIGR